MRATPTSPTATAPKSEANAGRIAGVFGLRGELKVDPSRIGDDVLDAGLAVRATLRDGSSRELRIRTLRHHKGRPLVAFEGVEDATAAEALVGATLTIDRDEVELGDDEFFDEDLVGCVLVDEATNALGDVVAVEHYPAQDVLVIALRQAQGDMGAPQAMVPLVRAFVKAIDVASKRIVVDLPAGLLNSREADQA